jgi:hypothetical protein
VNLYKEDKATKQALAALAARRAGAGMADEFGLGAEEGHGSEDDDSLGGRKAAAEGSDDDVSDDGQSDGGDGQDDEKVQLSEMLEGLGVEDFEMDDASLARAGFKTSDEDRRFLAGEFVPEDSDGAVGAAAEAAASPEAKAAAVAFLAAKSPPKFNFL